MAYLKHIHNLIRQATPKIAAEFNPDLLIAIASIPHLNGWK